MNQWLVTFKVPESICSTVPPTAPRTTVQRPCTMVQASSQAIFKRSEKREATGGRTDGVGTKSEPTSKTLTERGTFFLNGSFFGLLLSFRDFQHYTFVKRRQSCRRWKSPKEIATLQIHGIWRTEECKIKRRRNKKKKNPSVT